MCLKKLESVGKDPQPAAMSKIHSVIAVPVMLVSQEWSVLADLRLT